MFRNVLVSSETPRSLMNTNFAFIEGLGIQKWLSVFFILGAILLVVISLFVIENYFLAALFLVIGLISFWQFSKVNAEVKQRKEVYENGSFVDGKVINHSRAFKFYKSNRNYVVTLEMKNGKRIKIENVSQDLWDSAPVGKQILGLEYEGNYFFGQEVQCQFVTN